MIINEDWKPTSENVNALPEGLRSYVSGLETMCDPAGMVAENVHLKDEIDILRAAFEFHFNKSNRRKNVPKK